jgi:hypothetical protein
MGFHHSESVQNAIFQNRTPRDYTNALNYRTGGPPLEKIDNSVTLPNNTNRQNTGTNKTTHISRPGNDVESGLYKSKSETPDREMPRSIETVKLDPAIGSITGPNGRIEQSQNKSKPALGVRRQQHQRLTTAQDPRHLRQRKIHNNINTPLQLVATKDDRRRWDVDVNIYDLCAMNDERSTIPAIPQRVPSSELLPEPHYVSLL